MRRPLIIGVGGAHSGSGKTSVAEALLRYFSAKAGEKPGDSAGQTAPAGPGTENVPRGMSTNDGRDATALALRAARRWGALKYTKTEILSRIVDDEDSLNVENKDTWRLLKAGAEKVVWLQSPPEDLSECLPLAFSRLECLDAVIVEGNSAIEFIKPDVILFIDAVEPYRIKPSGRSLRAKADILIFNDTDDPAGSGGVPPPRERRSFCLSAVSSGGSRETGDGINGMVDVMEEVIKEKRVESLLAERSQEGRISCTEARRIAEEEGVTYDEVGRAANRLRIRIRNCELGCF